MKNTIKNIILLSTLLLPLGAFAQIEKYESLNEVCVVEKQGDGYKFLNNNELKARIREVVGKSTRNNFEWFYVYKKDRLDLYYLIQAKVYPQMRDAMIEAPAEEMKTSISACALTQENQRLAASVSYEYTSKDRICACLRQNGKINCRIKHTDLGNASFEEFAPFFESGGYPSVIIGIVPRVVFKAVWDSPKEYHQKVPPCDSNTTNEEIVSKL